MNFGALHTLVFGKHFQPRPGYLRYKAPYTAHLSKLSDYNPLS